MLNLDYAKYTMPFTYAPILVLCICVFLWSAFKDSFKKAAYAILFLTIAN